MTARRVFEALVVAVFLGAVFAPAAAAKELLDQKCQNQPDQFDSVAFPTVDQSFTPTTATISSWEAGIWVITGRTQTLKSRLVFHPTGDAGNGTGAAARGIVLAEAEAVAKASKFTLKWVRFRPAAPVDTIPRLQIPGAYSIEIDFPMDDTIPSGAHQSWYSCGDRYPGGRAYLVMGAADVPEAPVQAGVRLNYPRSENLLFRVYAG